MKTFLSFLCLQAVAMASEQSMKQIESDHGISLALSGMLIVFMGLTTIALFLIMLPKVLKLFEKREKPAPEVIKPVVSSGLADDMLAAITLVLHAESERASGHNLKVTLGLNPSPWALSSQMRVLPGRIKS